MLGHELRNPLIAISSAVEVLNRVDAASEIATNARASIGRQTLHLAHMMDDLLDVARVISGKVLLSRHPMDPVSYTHLDVYKRQDLARVWPRR